MPPNSAPPLLQANAQPTLSPRLVRAAALAGIATLALIWALEVVGPAVVAGVEPIGSHDPSAVSAYFGHSALGPLAAASAASVVPFLLFVTAVREVQELAGASRICGRLVGALAAAEVVLVLVKVALREALVATVGSGGDPMALFALYDALWNSLAYLVEGALLLFVSVAFMQASGAGRWPARIGFAAAAVQCLGAAALPAGLPPAVTLPGNLLFSAWFVATAVAVDRASGLAARPRRRAEGGAVVEAASEVE